jgi:hypothetical protein
MSLPNLMDNLKFQLVIQFEASTADEFSNFLELTEFVEAGLSDQEETIVDGHDFGLGEFNIFIHTNQPQSIFELAAQLVDERKPGISFAAGYRDFDEDHYTPLWPPNAKTFSVA